MLTFFTEYGNLGLFLFQLAVAAIFAYHGYPKVRQPTQLATGLGWPENAVRLLGVIEILSAAGILFGIAEQWAALALVLIMLGAIYMKIFKWKIPFWAHDNTGWEFDLALLGTALFFLTNPG